MDYRRMFEEAVAAICAIDDVLGIGEDGAGSPMETVASVKHWRGLLLWTLYHHQGSSSNIGQPIREALGMDVHERLTADQIREAREAAVNDI